MNEAPRRSGDGSPARGFGRVRASRSSLRAVATMALVGVAGWWLVATGTGADTSATLVVMGFSPDRANLITALLIEALLVALGTLVLAKPRPAALVAIAVFVAFYWATFSAETEGALGGSVAGGAFDPAGWGLTVLTLVATVLVVASSAAVIAAVARRRIVIAVADLRTFIQGSRERSRLVRPAAVAAAIAVLVVTLPVLGDMLNFEPDVHMRSGVAAGNVLIGTGPGASLPPVVGRLSDGVLANGGIVSSGAAGAVLSMARPWLAWRPTGTGTIDSFGVPSAWLGPPSTTQIYVYLPPGYAGSAARYPVVYEAPMSFSSWQTSTQLPSQMDALIDSGAIPPEIVVFAHEKGGPYPDSECANSADGREWFETWIVDTVVPAIDVRYRTIPQPAARAVMGFSQGGYCAPMLTIRHPDIFGSAVAFSGYFQAGVKSGETPNAWRPFGGNPTIEAQASPVVGVADLTRQQCGSLFFELSANTGETFFGPQVRQFATALQRSGTTFALFPTRLGHAWAAVRAQLAAVLETLAERETALGVFGA